MAGKVINCLTSYLTERSQTVKIGSTLSKKQLLKYGVPQGSVLGPLLFILYTSPLSKIESFRPLKHCLYAEDTQIYVNLTPETAPQVF
jgi:hypothetical protein